MSDPAQDLEVLPPEASAEDADSLMQRIDSLADWLIDFAKKTETTPTIRVKIFGEVVAWAKVKRILDPQGLEGNRLKEFHNELESRKGNGASKRAGKKHAASGAEIRKLIRSLPTTRGHADASADSRGAEREGFGDAGADGGGGADLRRDG